MSHIVSVFDAKTGKLKRIEYGTGKVWDNNPYTQGGQLKRKWQKLGVRKMM